MSDERRSSRSVPGDEASVAQAVARHPSRFVGFFMLDPTAPDAPARTEHAVERLGLRAVFVCFRPCNAIRCTIRG